MTEPTALIIRAPDDIDALCAFTVASLPSAASRRVYALRLREFIESGNSLTREGVGQWLNEMRDRECSAATVNQARAAIRKLVMEAEARELIPPHTASAIRNLKGDAIRGHKVGNWLTVEGVRTLLAKPDRTTAKGCRDAALLACLVGCGLRRQEVCDLEWHEYQEREGRRCWVDISGKGRKTRTVPIPEWARLEIERWQEAQKHVGNDAGGNGEAGETVVDDGELCEGDTSKPNGILATGRGAVGSGAREGGKRTGDRGGPGAKWGNPSILKWGDRVFGRLTPGGVWWLVTDYGEALGIKIRPHDLRRTLARLMRKAGVDLEQISQILGHARIETTRVYLGGILELGLQKAGVDRVEWEVKRETTTTSKD